MVMVNPDDVGIVLWLAVVVDDGAEEVTVVL